MFDNLYLGNGWRFSSNLECGLPWVEGTFIVNLVPFGSDIVGCIRIRENWKLWLFFLSTYPLCSPPPLACFLKPHDTLQSVLIHYINVVLTPTVYRRHMMNLQIHTTHLVNILLFYNFQPLGKKLHTKKLYIINLKKKTKINKW